MMEFSVVGLSGNPKRCFGTILCLNLNGEKMMFSREGLDLTSCAPE